MRHARDEDLDRLEDLLVALRQITGLTEKKRGTFYRRSHAFLHFHQDPTGLFADVRCADGKAFERVDVTEAVGRAALLSLARDRSA